MWCSMQGTKNMACIVYLKFWGWGSLWLWSRWYIWNSPSLCAVIVCITCTACRQPISCECFVLINTSIAADTTPSKAVIPSHAVRYSVHLSTSTLEWSKRYRSTGSTACHCSKKAYYFENHFQTKLTVLVVC